MTDQELDHLLDTWHTPETPLSLLRLKPLPARRVWRWLPAGALSVATLAVATTLSVYGPELGTSWGRLGNGTYFRTRTLVEPRIAALKYAYIRGSQGGHDLWREHYLYDDSSKTYRGYSITFEPLANHQYRVTVEGAPRSTLAGYRNVPLPSVPAPRIIGERDPVEIDLIRSSERVFDRIEVSSVGFDDTPDKRLPEGSLTHLWMRLANPKLFVNGVFVMEEPIDASGGALWFTLPGRGRWVMASDPLGNNRFVSVGHIKGNTIEFTLKGETIRIETSEPVVPGGERPVYVWHQQDFQTSTAEFGSSGGPSQYR